MSNSDLFSQPDNEGLRPLADRMRPRSVDDFRGQVQIMGKEKPLRAAIESDRLHSMIFWDRPERVKPP